jgi:hypothetical protein
VTEERSAASRAALAAEARKNKPRLPPHAPEPGALRLENYKQLVLDWNGSPFEGWTPITYVSTEKARHFFQKARVIVRFALTAFGRTIARFYVYEHACKGKKVGGSTCPRPDPSPTGALVREMERVEGRQIPALETLLPEDLARILSRAGALEGKIETVRWRFTGKGATRERVPLEHPYSKIAEIRPRVGVD